jgi:hypothetical protein
MTIVVVVGGWVVVVVVVVVTVVGVVVVAAVVGTDVPSEAQPVTRTPRAIVTRATRMRAEENTHGNLTALRADS